MPATAFRAISRKSPTSATSVKLYEKGTRLAMVSSFRRAALAAILALCSLAAAHAQQITPVIVVDHGPEAVQQQQKHYVVMVSLDGFRFDYAKKYGAKHILALGEKGARAPGG